MLEILFCLIVGVSDGDTIKARCGEPENYSEIKVRLNAIDAPENRQAFGNRAKQAMSNMAYMKEARLECLKKPDRYKRRVCNVYVAVEENGAKTLDVGLAMVTLGLAWNYPQYMHQLTPEQKGQYEFAEFEAKAKGAGLWRDKNPIPPWEWRKGRR